MEVVTAIALVLFASAAIFKLNRIAGKIDVTIHSDAYLDSHAKYQLLLVALSALVLTLLHFLSPNNLKLFLSIGNISAAAKPVDWFGISEGETWLSTGLYLCALITLGTFSFVYFQFRNQKVKAWELLPFLGWIALFSITNSFSEEVIYRLGVIAPLYNIIGTDEIILLSALLFGLVHFGGMPHGLIGMFMAGFLGWFLAKSVIETQGLFWAWLIHFIQDLVIYTGFMIHHIATNRLKYT